MRTIPQKKHHPRFIHQALASLLNKRAGGVEKEKDLFELPALPKKVLSININLKNMHFASRRMIGAVIVTKVPGKMLLMLLVLGMCGMCIRFSLETALPL